MAITPPPGQSVSTSEYAAGLRAVRDEIVGGRD